VLLLLGLALVLMLALNAFFVLAEFAIVKVRPSRVAELEAAGNTRAPLLAGIQKQLDQYLSVCQVGITLASVGLGMVGSKATDEILAGGDHGPGRYALAIAVSYVLVSGSHIVLGELVPNVRRHPPSRTAPPSGAPGRCASSTGSSSPPCGS
jgi:CBS domain containing-hemolysin-like protein